MRFGVNMFGVSRRFGQDPEGFLQKVQQMGYRYLEPAVSLEEIPYLKEHLGIMTLDEFLEYVPLLAKYGQSVYSMHIMGAVKGNEEKVLAAAKTLGAKQIICPLPFELTPESCQASAEELCELADFFGKEGMEVLIHNAKESSTIKLEDKIAYEWILDACGGKVGAQVDIGWLLYGGTDPEEFLWKHEKQVKSLHYKDFAKKDGEWKEAAIGHGEIDMMACFQFARYVEVIQLVDQDSSEGDILEDYQDVARQFGGLSQGRDHSTSILCTMDAKTGEIEELARFEGVIEAPNWYQQNPDFLFYNSYGHIFRYQISTGEAVQLESGKCNNCNNDHVLAADGTEIAVSHSDSGWQSQVYIFPIEGGEPRLITPNYPSFLHGWSPDKKELAYCAFRMNEENQMNVDIYTIPYEGGEEKALTQNAGFNDGPEYSPDGEYILFISTRTGLMQNWRMKRDGSEQTQMTFTERNNWFGHYSPDGKKIVYLSYSKDGLDPNEHLPNMQVKLGMMNADGSDDHFVLDFFGGQGSINVNSWSPDSRKFAFVKYELAHK